MLNLEKTSSNSESVTIREEIGSFDVNFRARDAVFTKPAVVRFILDLAGYTADKPLYDFKVLEPSFGAGNFLIEIVSRLLESCQERLHAREIFEKLRNALLAIELDQSLVASTKERLVEILLGYDFTLADSQILVDSWIVSGNFLLVSIDTTFEFVVGNPPYVRQESIDESQLREYRKRFHTIYDRADLYIPFIERSLSLLRENGKLGIICADRWMKNRYGGPLRSLISSKYHLEIYVDMSEVDAFDIEVSAYPAITIISRSKGRVTRIAHNPEIDDSTLRALAATFHTKTKLISSSSVIEMHDITDGTEPWLMGSSQESDLIRRLESTFPSIEEVGCKIGIGVATGADKVFICDSALDIEESRKVPIVTTRDISSGEVDWRGKVVINPYADDGGLVELSEYPRLKMYLELHKEVIAARHCVRKTTDKWFRTIDRIIPGLASRPKLLIPDIRGEAHVVFEDGQYYPHHNLYFVISDDWDLRALQAVFLSSVTKLFVSSYSTKMRGGYFRYQAQYLRRLRLPRWNDVSAELRSELKMAARSRNQKLCNLAASKLYALTENEIAAIGGIGE